MRLGVVILPEHSWHDAQKLWQRAEEAGFAHAWTYDHLAWRSLRDSPWFGAIPTLTAAALATSRIRLGPLVASPNFRHPVPFAKELITLDDVSGGRLTLGLGAGGTGWDATVLGHAPWPPRERMERFAEFVELSDLLLREPETSYEGRFYSAHEARTHPGCVQRPRIPFAIAANGPRGMRVAATHAQSWVTNGDRSREHPQKAEAGATFIREQMARLDDACGRIGREPSSVDRLVLGGIYLDGGLASVEAFRHAIGVYADEGATDFVVHWPRREEPFRADLRTFERICQDVVIAAAQR